MIVHWSDYHISETQKSIKFIRFLNRINMNHASTKAAF